MVERGQVAGVTRRAADRLRAGHLWVYRSDVEGMVRGADESEALAGALVTVVDGRGIPLGTAIYSAASEIALRMVSKRAGLTRAGYLEEMRAGVEAALALRRVLAPEAFSGESPGTGNGPGTEAGAGAASTNACRLVFSEADGLPGIVADRYNGLVILQLLTQGTAQDDVRRVLAEVLQEQSWVETVVERPDARVRELEQLEAPAAGALFSLGGPEAKLRTVFTINGLRFHFDATAGQKTGAFLDQRLNYAAAARVARGRALDVCTYQGGFALHLAKRCERVTGVDASLAALEVADRNLELNAGLGSGGGAGLDAGLDSGLGARVDWVEADAFELLREWEAAAERFDTIVLDPPAFAKSKRAAEGALRGYKELNLRAMKMLRPGGALVTCSCSHHVGMEEFMGVVRAAAADAGRSVQLLEMRGAAPDHPAILTLPETSYLKCLICKVTS
jgi:23S rRNA (cytosine1962-C5)-methyltransferase